MRPSVKTSAALCACLALASGMEALAKEPVDRVCRPVPKLLARIAARVPELIREHACCAVRLDSTSHWLLEVDGKGRIVAVKDAPDAHVPVAKWGSHAELDDQRDAYLEAQRVADARAAADRQRAGDRLRGLKIAVRRRGDRCAFGLGLRRGMVQLRLPMKLATALHHLFDAPKAIDTALDDEPVYHQTLDTADCTEVDRSQLASTCQVTPPAPLPPPLPSVTLKGTSRPDKGGREGQIRQKVRAKTSAFARCLAAHPPAMTPPAPILLTITIGTEGPVTAASSDAKPAELAECLAHCAMSIRTNLRLPEPVTSYIVITPAGAVEPTKPAGR